MLAYNKTTLQNLAIHEAIEEATDLNLISSQKEAEIKSHYLVDLYSPNIFVRIGLGLLTLFIVLASVGLIGLMTGFSAPVFLMILFAGGSFAFLSHITGTKKHFSSGVDHVLMFATISFVAAAIIQMLPARINEDLLSAAIVCSISFYLFLRFADSIMAIVSFGALVVFIVNAGRYFGSSSKIILPFMLMAVAGAVYFLCKRSTGEKFKLYYSKAMLVLELMAMLTFYAAGNYFIVDQLSKVILPGTSGISLPVWFKYFLWAFTLLVPPGFVTAGIKYKDVMLCRMGILCVVATVLTWRFYYSILSPEFAMVSAGCIVCGCAYFLSKYLKQPKGGFIFKNIKRRSADTANLEGVIIADTFSHQQADILQETTFGGGSFGGAGAGNRF